MTKLALSMLVWNEADVVGRAIDSVKEHLDYYCIVIDSRTTDKSVEVIKEHLSGIEGEIIYREFDDFHKQRNAALEPLKDKTDWVLILDADEVCVLKNFSREQLENEWAYLTIVHAGQTQYNSLRLINYNKPWYWSGAIHNYLECPGFTITDVLESFEIIHIHDGYRSKWKGKVRHDLKKLKRLTTENPDNERYWFYYAQTLRESGFHKKAIEAYLKRLESNKYPEETWFSMFMIANCYSHLNDWDKMIGWTLRAYDFRPKRVEPLYYAMIVARDNGLKHIHFALSRIAIEIPFPKDETLFVEEQIYAYKAKFEHAMACYYTGHKERALKYYYSLRDFRMDDSYRKQLEHNIAFIEEDLRPADTSLRPIYYNPGMSTFGDNYVKYHGFRRVSLDNADVDGVLWFGIYSDDEFDGINNAKKNINLHWCGSDVLWCIKDGIRISYLSKKENIHHTCENRVQKDELASVGINAEIAPMFSELIESYTQEERQKYYDVLVYTPERHMLYNVALMIDVAAAMPEKNFLFIGDSDKLTSLPNNVCRLNWQSQESVKSLLEKSKVYLRITEHDAFPDLTIKSFLSGVHVVSNWDFHGCHYVEKNVEDIVEKINLVIDTPVDPDIRTFYAENGFINNWSKILTHDYTRV